MASSLSSSSLSLPSSRVLKAARREQKGGRKRGSQRETEGPGRGRRRILQRALPPLSPPLALSAAAECGHACWQPRNGMPSNSESSSAACGMHVSLPSPPSSFLPSSYPFLPAMPMSDLQWDGRGRGETDGRTDRQAIKRQLHAMPTVQRATGRTAAEQGWREALLPLRPCFPVISPLLSPRGARGQIVLCLLSFPPHFLFPSVACLFSLSLSPFSFPNQRHLTALARVLAKRDVKRAKEVFLSHCYLEGSEGENGEKR